MSAGYNSGLSEYPNKGKLNLIESEDPEDVLQSKVDQLVKLIEQAKSIVFHTGAGISTSTGIPDFRGPKGVWTLESQVNIYSVTSPQFHPHSTPFDSQLTQISPSSPPNFNLDAFYFKCPTSTPVRPFVRFS